LQPSWQYRTFININILVFLSWSYPRAIFESSAGHGLHMPPLLHALAVRKCITELTTEVCLMTVSVTIALPRRATFILWVDSAASFCLNIWQYLTGSNMSENSAHCFLQRPQ
jgi:hypothetical protein